MQLLQGFQNIKKWRNFGFSIFFCNFTHYSDSTLNMRGIYRYIYPVLTALILCCPMALAQHQDTNAWHEAKSIKGNFKAVSAYPEIEVFSAPNVIMIKVNQSTNVRLFTILGKLISSQHLEPGIFEYHFDTHGIYIVQTEKNSCKIAI